MLSADVPEFIPKALRAKGQAATETKAEEDGSSTLAADALQTKPDLADESPTSTTKEGSTDTASSDVNTEKQAHLSGNDSLANDSLSCQTGMVEPSIPPAESNVPHTESNIPVLGVDQDAGISVGLEDLAAAAAGPITQGDEGHPVVASSLRATSAEFYPAGMYLEYNSPADSPGPSMSYTSGPSPHNQSGFMYPNKPPFYYEPNGYGYYCDSNWDYNQGYYNPMVNAGHYSAGEYFVPNGGFMYEGGDGGYPQQPPQGAGLMVDPPYFDPNLAAEYSGGFVDVPGSGGVGRGGGATGGAPGGYNKKYANKNRQKRSPDSGGGRGGAGGGGSRQPSNEMRICGQTGELTVGKRRPQGSTPQGRATVPQQDKVQASTIISNVKNWPTLNTGKLDKEKGSITPTACPSAPAKVPDQAVVVITEVPPPVAECAQAPPPSISFSSIAKKKSELSSSVAEPALVSSKQSNSGPSAVKAKKKDLILNKTSDVNKIKGAQSTPLSNTGQVSGVKTDSSKKLIVNESTVTKSDTEWTVKGKQPNSVKTVPSVTTENAAQMEDPSRPNSTDNQTPLTKSAKKKARKKNKKQAVAAASIMEESNEVTVGALKIESTKSEEVVLPATVEKLSVSVVPEKSNTVSVSQDQWPSKAVSTTASKFDENLEGSQPIAEPHKNKKSTSEEITKTCKNEKSASEDKENEATVNRSSSPVNSTVKQTNVSGQSTVDSSSTEEAKKAETIPEELTWVTVGKRSKSKKASLPDEPDMISAPQNVKSYKGNSNRDKPSAPQRSTELTKTKIAIKEIAPKDGSSGKPSAKPKAFVSVPRDGSSGSLSTKPKVIVSASKNGSSDIPSTKPRVVSKMETSAPISSLEGKPKEELDEVAPLSEKTAVPSTTVEPKKRDPNDPEVQKIMKQREIRKENIKREKKLNREAAALEKKAMANKDSKISVMPAASQRSAIAQIASIESFAIKSEDYPTLGAKKAPKSQVDKSSKNPKKEAVKKINGIIQQSPEQAGPNVAETKGQVEADAVTLSNVWGTGSRNVSATATSSQHLTQSIDTTSVPSAAPVEESSSVRPKVLSYSLAAASVPAATSRSSKTRSETTAPPLTAAAAVTKGKVSSKAKKNVQPPARSKHVKMSDKLEIDLWNLLAIKPSKSNKVLASSNVSQVPAMRTVKRTPVARPVRVLTTSVGKQPRIKGQKRKVPTAIQRYKKLHAQNTQDLLLLLADLKRRQDAEQSTDINTEGFREENHGNPQTSSSDLSNSTNNTSVPDVAISSSSLSNNSVASVNTSDLAITETSNSVEDDKSNKKKRKKNRGGGTKSSVAAVSGTAAADDSSTKSTKVVVETKEVPEGAVAGPVQGTQAAAVSALVHKALSPAEAKEIADRLAEELERLQDTKKIVKTNVITRELNEHLTALLQAIVRFQRRNFFHDQIKAKAKRRFVSGIKEVHQKLHKIQLLIVAQDVGRKIPMVAESAAALLKAAEAQHVPVVFGLNRTRLGRLARKEAGFYISCVGVLNYQGAEDSVKGIMSILPDLQRQQQLINASKPGASTTTTNTILEEDEVAEDSSLACDSVASPAVSTTSSSSSSSQSTPAKVSAASAHGSRSGPQVLRGKNGIRQMAAASGNLGAATATADASLDVNDKMVKILKEQKNLVSNKNQTS